MGWPRPPGSHGIGPQGVVQILKTPMTLGPCGMAQILASPVALVSLGGGTGVGDSCGTGSSVGSTDFGVPCGMGAPWGGIGHSVPSRQHRCWRTHWCSVPRRHPCGTVYPAGVTPGTLFPIVSPSDSWQWGDSGLVPTLSLQVRGWALSSSEAECPCPAVELCPAACPGGCLCPRTPRPPWTL